MDHFQLRPLFGVVTFSAELRSGKDQHLIFEYALRELNVKPDKCVFIDNTPKNLLIPTAMGMRTVLFDAERRDVDAFSTELNQLLLQGA